MRIYPLFLLIFCLTAQAEPPVRMIKVVRASWGGKNVTKLVADHCDGNEECEYEVSVDRLGETPAKTKKYFLIQYQCGTLKTLRTHKEPHDATDKVFTISCKPPLIASAFPPPGASTWPAMNYPYSIKKMILKDEFPINNVLTAECRLRIQKIYQSGKNFKSNIIQKFLRKARNMSFDGKDFLFYHYTETEDVRTIARKNRPLDIFNFLRTTMSTYWGSLFYIADDPNSSDQYGPIQIQVHIRPDAVVLDEYLWGEKNNHEIDDDGRSMMGETVKQEMRSRFPGIEDCEDYSSYGGMNSFLYYLSAEESGADLIHYVWNSGNGHWFQVLNPFAIDHLNAK